MTVLGGLSQSQSVDLSPPQSQQQHALGARPSLEEVYESEATYVWHTLRRLGVRNRDLEDLTHDLFVAVCRRLHDYDPARPIRPWLFGFAFRLASDYRKLARHDREVIDDEADAIDSVPLPDQQLAGVQKRQRLQAALDALDLDRRAVFVMHEIDGCSMPEISQTLSIPLNTAYSRLRLAREQFTAVVRRMEAKGGPS